MPVNVIDSQVITVIHSQANVTEQDITVSLSSIRNCSMARGGKRKNLATAIKK